MSRRGLCGAVLALAVLGVPACASGDGQPSACGPVEQARAQFPATHLLPGQPEPRYLTDPPTSGPHIVSVSVPGVVSAPLARPVQVGLLERGAVLLQYRPDEVAADQVASLEALAGPLVVVAPQPDLDDPVVASAWLRLQRCASADLSELSAFVEANARDIPGGHLGG